MAHAIWMFISPDRENRKFKILIFHKEYLKFKNCTMVVVGRCFNLLADVENLKLEDACEYF